MVREQLGSILRDLNRLAETRGDDATDGQLLERFDGQHDEAAFAALLRRHGPMVLGVCRRVLQDAHDAEDAFQATFLVLVRRAHALRKQGSVGGWLYKVAYHVALRTQVRAARRQAQERKARDVSGTESNCA